MSACCLFPLCPFSAYLGHRSRSFERDGRLADTTPEGILQEIEEERDRRTTQMRASFVEDLAIASAGAGDGNHSARLYPQFCCFRSWTGAAALHLSGGWWRTSTKQDIFSRLALLQLVADVSAWRGNYAGLWAHTVTRNQ